MSKNFFEIRNVDFNIDGKTKVKNVSFSIEKEGDVICLLGPSGIGKTTILRTVAGLERIRKGSIELNGKILSSDKINIEPENRNVSLAFQDNSLFPHYDVQKNIFLVWLLFYTLYMKNRQEFGYWVITNLLEYRRRKGLLKDVVVALFSLPVGQKSYMMAYKQQLEIMKFQLFSLLTLMMEILEERQPQHVNY